MSTSSRITIDEPVDVERVRRRGRSLARSLGFGPVESEAVALSISELATNLLRYAQSGAILLDAIDEADRRGVRIESRDSGPGISDVERALRGGSRPRGASAVALPAFAGSWTISRSKADQPAP
jgi:serine/threonine-protein kinase RsbT